MNGQALALSIQVAGLTVLALAPIAIALARTLAMGGFRGRALLEASIALPLVLPPTVLGYALLLAFSGEAWPAELWRSLFETELAFSFEALVIASMIVNLPFAVQPIQRAYVAIGREVMDAAALCGMGPIERFARIEAPLIWPGALAAAALVFAHTLGEFGVVLMVGGAIPGETETAAIAIYDAAQSFDDRGAAKMSAVLMAIALAAVACAYLLAGRIDRARR